MSAPSTSRVVAIIPARYASTRLPGKPLVDIAGKPMIQHVYERTRQAALVDDVIVATDDPRIAEAVRAFGGRAEMTSPDIRSGSDRIAVVARTLPETELIVNIQGDEPLIPSAMIDDAIRPLLSDPSIPVGTLAARITTSEEFLDPHTVKVALDRNSRCLYFSRSPIPFGRDMTIDALLQRCPAYRHIGVYVYRTPFLLRYTTLEQTPLELAEQLEQLRVLEHGYFIHAVLTTYQSIGVDTPADLERVRALAGHLS
jgi:3-deoxy-manno-octulosonate cytidylyltransferase (CMP-KDO synthetase)